MSTHQPVPGAAADHPGRAAGPLLEFRGVSVGYGPVPVLHDLDFALDRGEVVALVGPNGSGKSTMIRAALGLIPIGAGELDLFGIAAHEFKQRWRIGYVPQRHTVVGAVPSTVREVVASGRLARRRPWQRASAHDRAAVDRAIGMVGLAERRDVQVSALSGGQQRRALIARALAAEPELLIMDEPTAGVDAESQVRLVATLEDLVAEHGLTLLVVTHEIDPLYAVLTRTVTLSGGRISSDEQVTRLPVVPSGPAGACHPDATEDGAGPLGLTGAPLGGPSLNGEK